MTQQQAYEKVCESLESPEAEQFAYWLGIHNKEKLFEIARLLITWEDDATN